MPSFGAVSIGWNIAPLPVLSGVGVIVRFPYFLNTTIKAAIDKPTTVIAKHHCMKPSALSISFSLLTDRFQNLVA